MRAIATPAEKNVLASLPDVGMTHMGRTDEGEQIGIELLGVKDGHAVGKPGVNL
jgi:hypothetical protein